MAGAVAEFLPTFAPGKRNDFDLSGRIKPLGAPEPKDATDHLAMAEERGRRQGFEAARLEVERARIELLADFDLRLASERQNWVEETADRLAVKLDVALGEIRTTLVDTVADALGLFLTTAIRQRAVDELSQTVLALLHDGRHAALSISGPEELLSHLRGRLDEHAKVIEYVTANDADVRVAIDDTAVATRIAEWIARLDVALLEMPHG
jgi:hypothetical protein